MLITSRIKLCTTVCIVLVVMSVTVFIVSEQFNSTSENTAELDSTDVLTKEKWQSNNDADQPTAEQESAMDVAELTAKSGASDEVLDDESSKISTDLPKNYLPLKALEITEAQSRALHEAEELLVKNCMNERGFEYVPNTFDDERVTDTHSELSNPIDITTAKTHGYGLADSIGKPGGIDSIMLDTNLEGVLSANEKQTPNNLLLSELSAEQQMAWKSALMGDISQSLNQAAGAQAGVSEPLYILSPGWDANSCSSIAKQQLYENNMSDADVGLDDYSLQEQVYSLADSDSEYQRALDEWRKCMANNGLPFEYRGEAVDHLIDEYTKGNLREEELKTREIKYASTESHCYHQSDVVQAYKSALEQAEATLLTENSESIIQLRQAIDDALERASALIQ